MALVTSQNIISLALLTFFVNFSFGDLVALKDSDLGAVDGAGVGIVLEDFTYQAGSKESAGGATFELGGLETSDNKAVTLSISQFYVAGFGSAQGTIVDNNPVNIGRLGNPFNFELLKGETVGISNKAVLEFSAPKNNALASRIGKNADSTPRRNGERPDIGIRFDMNIAGDTRPVQSLENHIESLSIDGSYIRLWGNGKKTHANLALNLRTPKMTFFACNAGGANCGDSVIFENLSIDAKLGYGDKQPVTFEVDSDGQFVFEVGNIKSLCTSFNSTGGCTSSPGNALNDFYTNGPKANVFVGNVRVGNQNFGSTTVNNLQIQYLHVKSHDL